VADHILLRQSKTNPLLSKLRSEGSEERLEIRLLHDPQVGPTDGATLGAHEPFHHEQNSCIIKAVQRAMGVVLGCEARHSS
jgi:hypothetical protein